MSGGDRLPPEALGALEALLFTATEPVEPARLARALGFTEGQLRLAVDGLRARYAGEESGIELVEVAGGLMLGTKPAFAPLLEEMGRRREPAPLSRAALETLAIVAYRQPVPRPEIEAIRGVNCESPLRTLLDRGLIRPVGRREAPGRPTLYGTTDAFLRAFGLRHLGDLPDPEPPSPGPDAWPLETPAGATS